MNEAVYRKGIRVVHWMGGIPVFTAPLDALSRIWGRHARLRKFLQWGNFDGLVDGGANVGEFASLVRKVLPKADLLCVEPHPGCASVLRNHGFRVAENALWKEKGRIALSQPTPETTSCTVISMNGGKSVAKWEIDAVRLNDLTISGKKILVKLDLQGAEEQALEGMEELWSRCAALLLEVSIGANGNYETLRSLLSTRGYFEYSTVNELEDAGRVVEADKIWLHKTAFASGDA